VFADIAVNGGDQGPARCGTFPRRRRLRDLGEEALDEIQPGDAGRGEDGNETADAPGVTFSPWDA
jgi:hypothetical protein